MFLAIIANAGTNLNTLTKVRLKVLFFQLTDIINFCIFDHIEILFIVVIHDISTNDMMKISQSYVVIDFFQLFQIYFHQRLFTVDCIYPCMHACKTCFHMTSNVRVSGVKLRSFPAQMWSSLGRVGVLVFHSVLLTVHCQRSQEIGEKSLHWYGEPKKYQGLPQRSGWRLTNICWGITKQWFYINGQRKVSNGKRSSGNPRRT